MIKKGGIVVVVIIAIALIVTGTFLMFNSESYTIFEKQIKKTITQGITLLKTQELVKKAVPAESLQITETIMPEEDTTYKKPEQTYVENDKKISHADDKGIEITTTTCGNIASTNILTQNATATGTCFTITGDNLLIDCQGNTITYNTDGANNSYGIYATNRKNVTIKNCILIDKYFSGTDDYAIYFRNVNSSMIENNTILKNTTTSIMYLTSINDVSITNNTFDSEFIVSANDKSIIDITLPRNVSIEDNNITFNATGGSSYIVNVIKFNSSSGNIYNLLVENNTVTQRSPSNLSIRLLYVYHSNLDNLTFKNNKLKINTTASGSSGLQFEGNTSFNMTNITISDNDLSIYTGGTNYFIQSNTSLGIETVNISNNNATMNGTNNFGINLQGTRLLGKYTIQNNSFSITGTTNIGIKASRMKESNIIKNVFVLNGTSGISKGLELTSATFGDITELKIENNELTVNDFANSYGMHFITSLNNTLVNNNTISTNCTRCDALYIDTDNMNFTNNNLTTTGAIAYAIRIKSNKINNRFIENYLNNPTQWIITGLGANISLTNTTFAMFDGSIKIIGATALGANKDITKTKLNITYNRAFLNSTSFPELNKSAIITLKNIYWGIPNALVDYNDDWAFADCAGNCTRISYVNNKFVFGVSRFSSYSSNESGMGIKITKTSNPNTLNLTSNTLINYTISVNITSSAAYNVTIKETYPANTTFVNSTPNPTSNNNTWSIGNLKVPATYQINITVNVSDKIYDLSYVENTATVTAQNIEGQTESDSATINTLIRSKNQQPPVGVYGTTPSQTTPSVVGHNYLSTGLIGEWRMENTADETGLYNLTKSGGTPVNLYNNNSKSGKHFATLYAENTCYFSKSSPNMLPQNFTVSLWSKDYIGFVVMAVDALAAECNMTGGNGGWIMHSPNAFYWCNATQPARADAESINVGAYTNTVWNHFLFTFDSTENVTGYLNGVKKATKPTHGIRYNATTLPFTIGGQDGCSGNHLSGKLDEITFYNRTLNQTEITDLYLYYNGTVKLTQPQDFSANVNNASDSDTHMSNITAIFDWRIGEQSIAQIYLPFEANGQESTYTKGYSSYVNDGNVTSATWNSTGGYDGFGAYQYDGIDDFINVTKNASIELNNTDFTIALWFKSPLTSGNQGFFAKIPYAYSAFNMNSFGIGSRFQTTIFEFAIGNGSGNPPRIQKSGLPTNTWIHIAITHNESDGLTMLYVNGTYQSNKTYTGGYNENYDFLIGVHETLGFNGSIDDFRVYKRELTSAQIKLLALWEPQTIQHEEAHPLEYWEVCTTLNDRISDSATSCVDVQTDNPPLRTEPIPEFSTIMMLLAILIVISGIFAIRNSK